MLVLGGRGWFFFLHLKFPPRSLRPPNHRHVAPQNGEEWVSHSHAAALIHVHHGAAGPPAHSLLRGAALPHRCPCHNALHSSGRPAQPCNALCPLGGNAVPLHGSGCNTTSPSTFCTAHGAIRRPPHLNNATPCTACVQCNSPHNTATPCKACVQCPPHQCFAQLQVQCNTP